MGRGPAIVPGAFCGCIGREARRGPTPSNAGLIIHSFSFMPEIVHAAPLNPNRVRSDIVEESWSRPDFILNYDKNILLELSD